MKFQNKLSLNIATKKKPNKILYIIIYILESIYHNYLIQQQQQPFKLYLQNDDKLLDHNLCRTLRNPNSDTTNQPPYSQHTHTHNNYQTSLRLLSHHFIIQYFKEKKTLLFN